MAVSNSEAIRIFQKFFRGPVLKTGSRKYIFDTFNVTAENISALHLEFYNEGSDISRQEILSFIDQKINEDPIPFLNLSISHIAPGEVFSVIERNPKGVLNKYFCIKCTDTHYIVAKERAATGNFEVEIKTLSNDFILSEQGKSPFQTDSIIL